MWPWSKPYPDPEMVLLRAQVARLEASVEQLGRQIDRSSTVSIRADLDNLTGRVESFAASTSKQLGKLWQRERAPIEREPDGTITRPGSTGDPELDDLLAIQAEWARGRSNDGGEPH